MATPAAFVSEKGTQRQKKVPRQMAEPETTKIKVAEGTLKKVIITGITGQDGSYLAEFLLEKVGLFITNTCVCDKCLLSNLGGARGLFAVLEKRSDAMVI